MTSKELATILNGRTHTKEITKVEEDLAKANGLVVVFPYSDDNVEFRGAINDEIGCWNGGKIYLNTKGIIYKQCEDEHCPYYEEEKKKGIVLECIWHDKGEYAWTYEIPIQHECFDIIDDDDTSQKWGRGIVFYLNHCY